MFIDNVCVRMVSSGARVPIFVVALAVSIFSFCGCQNEGFLTATACYGNTNNYLRLDCVNGYYIHVLRVIHAAKLKTADCVSPASVDTYKRECCGYHVTDCNIIVQDGASIVCENKSRCDAVATWSNTNKECDQDIYPPNTNYMKMEYMCRRIRDDNVQITTTASTQPRTSSVSTTTSTTETTTTVTTTNPDITTTSASTSVAVNTTSGVVRGKTSSAAVQSGHTRSPQDNEELSDAMIGAIVGGCLGMVFTFVVFIFYWGRKRRLRIVSKPQPSVWDYLLSQTFTVRGAKGYDHFSSIRSSASSQGDPTSPVVRYHH
ncbi:unnamed protein product [Candidula unifasciata]|uniref:Uncharacterized protein n=1 Tax=Candidula unifasciata TaxID=100452 RepID=A0A8S3Z589_9EUPU|nr:unnamed protein product [Candidula unifasciata]